MHLPRAILPSGRSTSRGSSLLVVLLGFALGVLPLSAEVDKSEADGKKAVEEAQGELGGQELDPHEKLAREGEENLRQISELMKKIQNNLANKQTGGDTQDIQRETVKKIDDLVEKLLQQAQSSSGGSSGQQQSQSQQQQQSGDQKQGEQQQQGQREQGMKPEQQGQQQDSGDPQQRGKERYGPTENDQVSEGKNPPVRPENLREALSDERQWGLLPKKLQEEIRDSKGREFPAEYRELIADYYRRLAEIEQESTSGSGDR